MACHDAFALIKRALVATFIFLLAEGVVGQPPRGYQQQRRKGPNVIQVGKENKRGVYLAIFVGIFTGFWLGGWKLRNKNKKLKQKYEKEIKTQEKRIDDALKMQREQYEEILERKQEDYVEKYKHLQYIENALNEAGIPIDLASATAAGMYSGMNTLEQDYAEFKQPDANGDDRISRKEFNDYMRQYLKENPEYSQYDYPSFDEFDKNRDGSVSFSEWQAYIQHAEQAAAAQDQYYQQQQAAQRGGKAAGGRR